MLVFELAPAINHARMAELVDARDLKSLPGKRGPGSIPGSGTLTEESDMVDYDISFRVDGVDTTALITAHNIHNALAILFRLPGLVKEKISQITITELEN